MSLLYEVRGLVRRYGRVTALDLPALGVDELRIHSGRVLTLVGYNGSGKSTLLRLLAFLEEPDEGRIIYHGGEDPRREVSLLLQEPYLLKTTVFENVVLGLKLRGRRDGLEDAYQDAIAYSAYSIRVRLDTYTDLSKFCYYYNYSSQGDFSYDYDNYDNLRKILSGEVFCRCGQCR